MSAKADRQADHDTVAAYHEAQLGDLIRRVTQTVEHFEAGEIDAYDTDADLFQYSRAAKSLWTFCNTGLIEKAARTIREDPPIDWWDRGAFRRR